MPASQEIPVFPWKHDAEPGGSQGKPHLTHPEAEGPLPGVLLLQVQVGVEEDEEDVALQVLQAPQLQRPRLPLILARLSLEGTSAWLRHPCWESIPGELLHPTLSHSPGRSRGKGLGRGRNTVGTKMSASIQPAPARVSFPCGVQGVTTFPEPKNK